MSEKKSRALLTGSFDPVTKGHESVLRRALDTYDEVYAVVFINADKKGFFPIEARVELLKRVCEKYPRVTVDASRGYVADYAKEMGIDVIVRGVRDDADLAYEKRMAEYNAQKCGVTTVFFPAEDGQKDISSHAVREMLLKGGDPSPLLPKEIAQEICENWRFFCAKQE